ncbi:MAG: DUF4397 domain-containing protein [Sediminibacterium sp.]|nr:DUF4397 domain-containing protein [Sediminibacterium sp.]
MKKIFIYSLIFFGIAAVISACTKDKLLTIRSEETLAGKDIAQVKFIHALSSNSKNTATTVTPTTAPPAMNFFVNGVRLNAISSASATFTTAYGGAFPGTAIAVAGSTNGNNVFDYAVIPSGTAVVTGAMFRLTGGSAADTVLSTSLTFEKSKKYTIVAADTIPNQRFFAFEDVFLQPDTGNYAIRLINLGMNIPTVGAAPTAIDVFSRRRQANLVSNIPYKGASAYVESRVANLYNGVLTTTDTLEIRATGTTVALAQINGFFPVRTRVYTFVTRGVSRLASPRNFAVAGYLNQ